MADAESEERSVDNSAVTDLSDKPVEFRMYCHTHFTTWYTDIEGESCPFCKNDWSLSNALGEPV